MRRVSVRSMEAASAMGLDLERTPRDARECAAWRGALRGVSSSPCCVVLGPSGSGKSTLLRRVEHEARAAGERVWTVGLRRGAATADRPIIDLLGADWLEASRALARAGLAEAACLVKRPRELSAGQLYRLRLAIAMHGIDRSTARGQRLLIVDEFAGNLDSATGRSVARLLGRWARGHRPGAVRLVVAAPREDVVAALGPVRVVRLDGAHRVQVVDRKGGVGAGPRIVVERGTFEDYRVLAPLHYRGGRPAAVVRVLRAREGPSDETIGVLVVSMPVMNGAWRRLAWPGLFDGAGGVRRMNAAREGLRCISRVVVDSRYRGAGVATRLVRAYLRRPMTAYTEALAAMGRASSFFESAGMSRYDMPPSERNARLLDLLEQHGIAAHELCRPRRAFASAASRIGRPLLTRELTRWCGVMPRWRRGLGTSRSIEGLFRVAASRIGSTPVAFAHTEGA